MNLQNVLNPLYERNQFRTWDFVISIWADEPYFGQRQDRWTHPQKGKQKYQSTTFKLGYFGIIKKVSYLIR